MTTLRDMLYDFSDRVKENTLAPYEDQVDPEVLVEELLSEVKHRLIGS